MENVQIYPSKVRVVPNVKLIKSITKFDDEIYQYLLDGEEGEVVEKRNHKKHGKVATTYKISNADGYDDDSPLTEFDAAVLSAAVSEQKAGNEHTTSAIILRALTGKVGKHDAEAWTNQNKAVLHSVTKLMQTIITIDLSDTNEALGYNGGEKQKLRAPILPCEFVMTEVNGQTVNDVIHFYRESPIMMIAEQRNQILRYDTALLDVLNQHNTPRVIVLKNYVCRRVVEIKLHKMTPTLTFDDIFKRARISDASYDTKRIARDTVKKFFEHLKSKSFIKSFELVKNGVSIYGVKFAF